MKRRLLRICTVLALCLSLLPAPALAAEGDLPTGCSINFAEETITIPEGSSLYETADSTTALFTANGENNNTYDITKHIPSSGQQSAKLYLQAPETEGAAETGRTEISIPARSQAPTATIITIDYDEEKISSGPGTVTSNWEYSTDSTSTAWNDVPSGMALSEMGWDGNTPKTYYFRSGATDTSFASSATTIPITAPARPAKPADPTTVEVTSNSITIEVVSGQEYRLGSSGDWEALQGTAGSDGQTVYTYENLTPGTEYTIETRTPADGTIVQKFASHPASITVTTERTDSTLTVEPTEDTLTYGETLTITVTPEQTAANGINTQTAQNAVELKKGNTVLASTTTANGDGSYTLTYDTQGKGLAIGTNTLTVSYGGSGSLNPSTATVTVMLEKKDVDATLDGTASKTYDGTTAAPAGLTIELTGVLEGDDVTAAGTIAYDTKDVGNNKRITASDLTLTGADAGYYNLTSDDIEERTGSITAAVLGGALTITGTAQQGQSLTANYTRVNDEEVAYQWNRGGTAIPEATGSTYTLTEADIGQSITVTATATDDNHTGSVTSGPVTVSRPSSGGSGSPARYRTEVPEDIEGGAVAISPARAARGRTVTLTVTPDGGWQLDRLTVRDSAGDPVELTRRDDGTYTFTMPRGGVEIGVSFVPVPLPFADVPADHWAGEAIRWAYAGGYLYGTAPGLFAPDSPVTRQQVWMILSRLSGQGAADMAAARAWAVDAGVSDGSAPGSPVTRQQLAAMLYRFAMRAGADVSVGEDTNILSYADAFDVAEYAIPAMQWACGAGVIGGTADGRLNPAGTATRAHLAAMLQRFRAED